MTSCPETIEPFTIELAFDFGTRELSWVYTQGLSWYGYPELAVQVPPGQVEEPGALAVVLSAALVALGRDMMELNGFLSPDEIRRHTSELAGEPVEVWVTAEDPAWSPLPAALLAEDVFLVTCSLWEAL
jgi:hypothetical protein